MFAAHCHDYYLFAQIFHFNQAIILPYVYKVKYSYHDNITNKLF